MDKYLYRGYHKVNMQQLVTQFDSMSARSVVATPSCCCSCCCCCCVVTLIATPIVSSRSLRKTYQENEPILNPSFWEGANIPADNLPVQDTSPAPSPNRPPLKNILRKNYLYYFIYILLLVFSTVKVFFNVEIPIISQVLGIGQFYLFYLPLNIIVLAAWGVTLAYLYRQAGYRGVRKPILTLAIFVAALIAEAYVWMLLLL